MHQIVGVAVVSTHVIAPPFRTGRRLHRVEVQPDDQPFGRRAEEVKQLALGRHQGGIRHVVDQPDIEALRPVFQ